MKIDSSYQKSALYDMVDVALTMKGWTASSIEGIDYPRIIYPEICAALIGLQHEGIPLHDKRTISAVSQRIRNKYIHRANTLEIQLENLSKELIENGTLSRQEYDDIKRSRGGIQKKIQHLLALERLKLNQSSLAPGIGDV